MASKEFNAFSQWVNVPHAKKEKISGPSKTSMAGYIPADVLIKSLMDAGQRLHDSRTAMYDIPAGTKYNPDEIMPDPTRSKGFDMADASMMAQRVSNELQTQKKAAIKAAQEAEKAKKQDVPVKPAEKVTE